MKNVEKGSLGWVCMVLAHTLNVWQKVHKLGLCGHFKYLKVAFKLNLQTLNFAHICTSFRLTVFDLQGIKWPKIKFLTLRWPYLPYY